MAVICPTVTPSTPDPHEYRVQLERVANLSRRLQLDFMDGEFAKPAALDVKRAWWPEATQADIHLMYQRPEDSLEAVIAMKPSLIILHAEADGDLVSMLTRIRQADIKAGVALLQDTTVESAKELVAAADHVLIFAGSLGTFGGVADLSQLNKVSQIRAIKPDIEIGWDGGASLENVRTLADGGIDVINAGGAIQRAPDPAKAFAELQAQLSS